MGRGIRSIAFPAISTGVYGFPKREAAAVAFGPELHETEAFPGIVAYGIAAAGGAVIGALVGRLVFSIRQAGRFRRFP